MSQTTNALYPYIIANLISNDSRLSA
uniref:Uncharacterized protein n=1 Tax=Arundo donax TaxID=35708 RepID=A0A0A9BCG6_ARUDO